MFNHLRYFIQNLLKIVSGFLLVFILYCVAKIIIYDTYIIPSYSMAPTLIAGDRVLVNKLLFGARVYTKYNFSKGEKIESFRIPGFRRIKPGDILVFNHPQGYHRPKIEFKINYVYCKRCVGTPGDSVRVSDGFFSNDHVDGPVGYVPAQNRLRFWPDTLIAPGTYEVFPNTDFAWTIKDWGAVYVPERGVAISLDSINYLLYKELVEYETGKTLELFNGEPRLDGDILKTYTPDDNYYFCCGDNLLKSIDSRYWGFVPEEFIVGIITRITYSRAPYSDKIDKNRIFKRIQ